MERYSDKAIEIINELHTERIDYESEYIPLIDCANQCAAYEDTGLAPEDITRAFDEAALQEREERSKGCEFCNTYDFGRCGIDEHRIFMAGGNSRVDANEQFKFCPRCGRPLKGAQDESICM